MEKTKEQFPLKKWILRFILLVYDVTAVNLAYFLALVIRFYVNNQFHWDGATYIANYVTFAPYYTVACIIVFILFRLYDGMWRYAGIRDFNRILNANIITCLIHTPAGDDSNKPVPVCDICYGIFPDQRK